MQKSKYRELICMILFMAGLLIFFYPFLHGYYVNMKMETTTKDFLEWVDAPEQEFNEEEPNLPDTAVPEKPEIIPRRFAELWNDMTLYNQNIWQERQTGLRDPRSYRDPSFRLTDYGMDKEVFGILSIPRLKLNMPLYLGATWQHMADGAAQLSQTSLPIGGENTNCVIAGHRGWRGFSYFKYIDALEVGDEVIIRNPWQLMQYRVKEIKIVAPNDVQAIHIQPGRDLVTLLTCHPYASGGKQRYLVICERSNQSEKEEIQ